MKFCLFSAKSMWENLSIQILFGINQFTKCKQTFWTQNSCIKFAVHQYFHLWFHFLYEIIVTLLQSIKVEVHSLFKKSPFLQADKLHPLI